MRISHNTPYPPWRTCGTALTGTYLYDESGVKKQAICRGSRGTWRIMTSIWGKIQGFGPETIMQDTHIAYNLVAVLSTKI